MECHYKVLGVDLKADDESIKKAYRKAALRYHPDKNPDCLEEATERFRLVQAAYEVLSDPQERAWYDRHREEILHRKKYENYKDNSIDLWEYFSPSAYRGFGADERGFYAVYRDVFRKIDAEDEPFRTEDSDDNDPMPIFGDGESDYDDVVHVFYSTWQAYRTHLSFVWENQYDVKEAPNRRVARMIEKENKKERDKHKKKRNELVRELVAYVRKRDPRVKAHRAELERIAEEQAQKAEERRASALREKVEKAAEYDEANKEEMMKHHERVAALEDMMKDEFGFSTSEDDDDDEDSQKEDEEEEEYKDELFCVACNKLFKSGMGLRNHQKSKKHKENVNRLQKEMKEEQNGADSHEETVSVDTPTIENPEENSKNSKLSKKQKKQRKQQQKLLNNMMSVEPLKVEDLENSEQVDTTKNQSVNEEKAENDQQNENLIEEMSKEIPVVENEIPSEDLQPEGNITVVDESDVTENTSENVEPQNTNGQNRNKRTIHKQKKPKQQPPKSDLSTEQLNCGKCSQVFRSRNKLFQHLKQTGHSLPLEGGKPKRKDKRTRK